MLSCSEGAWGLSVPLRVIGIFTDTSISPGSRLRQCSDRYSIRAGRNLPDKEFRYLRTVIVTAAVHRGFSSMLAHLALTFRHRAGVRPYTSTYVLAESCVFVKQSPEPFHCAPPKWGSFLPKLQDYFAEFLSRGSPERLRIFFSPICVDLRYGLLKPSLRGFSRKFD